MIRKLTKQDNDNLMNLIMEEPEYNLYIIGDIENFGYDQDFFELFGEFDKYGSISAVLVRYFGVFNLYAKDEFNVNGFANIMKDYEKLKMLVGKTEILSRFEAISLGFNISELHHFAVLKEINPAFEIDRGIIVKKVNQKDVERIANLKNKISEFSNGSSNFKEILINDLRAGTAHGYYVEIDDNMVSYAQTSAENSNSAMLVSVMTSKEHRKKGLASACIKTLCNDVIKHKKTLCLFYKNSEAGAIYRRLGFNEIGFWSMYIKA